MIKYLLIMVFGFSTLGLAYADYDFNACHGDKCFVYIPNFNQTPYTQPPFQTNQNVIMDIHLPDHKDLYGVVLSQDNFTALKNNVAYMAVLNIGNTNLPVTTNYCPLAQTIWDYQDGYQSKLVNLTKYVIPPYCATELHPTPIPEFGSVVTVVMLVSIIGVLMFFRFRMDV